MSRSAPHPVGPLVVACLRVCDLRPEVDPLDGAVSTDLLGIGLAAADAAALELALTFAERWSGNVLAVAAGPADVEAVLRDAVALGASAVRVPWGDETTDHGRAVVLADDEGGLARTVASVINEHGGAELVVCGDRSADRGTGAFPALLAHELQAAQALGLVSLAADPERPRSLLAERRLDGGWRERLRVPLPAVCSVEGAGRRLRRAGLAAALEAGTTAVPVASTGRAAPGAGHRSGRYAIGGTRPFAPRARVRPAPPGDDPRDRLLALTGVLVAHEPPTVVGPLGAEEAADELLAYLVRQGYLDELPGADRGREP